MRQSLTCLTMAILTNLGARLMRLMTCSTFLPCTLCSTRCASSRSQQVALVALMPSSVKVLMKVT